MASKRMLFGAGGTTTAAGDVGLLLLRVFAGLSLALAHGIGKVPPPSGFVGMVGEMGLPAPTLLAWAAGLAELVGGFLLALGLLTRPVAFVLVVHFVVVVALAHAGDPFRTRELGLAFLAISSLFLLAGPGRFSVDAAMAGGRR